MTDGPRAPGRRPGPSPSLAEVLAALDGVRWRRRFRPIATGEAPEPGTRGAAGPGAWPTIASLLEPASLAARSAADPVAGLGIAELTGALAFHAVAVPVVDLATSALVVSGVVVPIDPAGLRVRVDGTSVVELRVAEVPVRRVAGAGDGEAADEVAAQLVSALDPLVRSVEPVDPALRWGAVADLVTVLALARSRVHHLDAEATWIAAAAVVAGLRRRRPHPADPPARLSVPAGPARADLVLARRSTCCQWYRAARQLGDGPVADARCADCPSLDVEANRSRLAALAASDGLGSP